MVEERRLEEHGVGLVWLIRAGEVGRDSALRIGHNLLCLFV
jgi:hypothetical protein